MNHLYFTGVPLESVEKDFQASLDVMTLLRQDHARNYIKAFILFVKKLRGCEMNNEIEDMKNAAIDSGDSSTLALIYYGAMETSVILGDWEDALQTLEEAGDIKTMSQGLFGLTRIFFIEALIMIHAARDASSVWEKREWKEKALQSITQIRRWVQNGAVNIIHNLRLLAAELASLEGEHDMAEKNYEAAINVASQHGFLQDKALSHELTSAYFLKRGDEFWANYHREKSRKSYLEWGLTRE